MRIATITLTGVSAYSSSAQVFEPKLEREGPDAYDERTWRLKMHTKDGMVIIPGVQFKKALDWTVKHLGEKIPGKGSKRWTAFFESGTIPLSDVELGVNAADVQSITVSCNPQGKRGGGARVPRRFPIMPKWTGSMQMAILDDTITKEVFERHVFEAGRFCGLGRWRPMNTGMNGRFEATFEWK